MKGSSQPITWWRSAGSTSVPTEAGVFVLAGLLEVGGGYLIRPWLREGRSIALGVVGGLVLFLYGVVPTLQPAHFGRVYAAYGGFFVILAPCGSLASGHGRRPSAVSAWA